ncbi:hypothetical protein KVG29_07630 [Caldicoprobacter algeriensis]|uniref:hypothetical protein n=1 Tax=Caldicoprobacter algeriensis TaxID=699281 RepID=UPI002079CA0B|nr:hypothetical protein [Caldicoprobacter algeriensis]MCM8901096.1 hypothetical protein [Caldicoprobacter algeriensis]
MGTQGRVEVRTTGDCQAKGEPYALLIRNTETYVRCEDVALPTMLAQDFINRIEGRKDVIISGEDVLMSSLDAIEIDESLEEVCLC